MDSLSSVERLELGGLRPNGGGVDRYELQPVLDSPSPHQYELRLPMKARIAWLCREKNV